jgi:hypothetical protein
MSSLNSQLNPDHCLSPLISVRHDALCSEHPRVDFVEYYTGYNIIGTMVDANAQKKSDFPVSDSS